MDNGFGEGEAQALHHAWAVSQSEQSTVKANKRVEIMSVDTDVWRAALLVYAVYPATQNARVVVRSQRGVGSSKECQHIDVLKLFDEIQAVTHWPQEFTPLQRCLPVVAAYILCGTNFTPTLHSVTSLSMFDSYYQAAKNAGNFDFIRGLGKARTEGGVNIGLDLDRKECVKFVGL
ncbi:unnamed protein product [Pylaiella littoralis]